jgi:hypothetical protein
MYARVLLKVVVKDQLYVLKIGEIGVIMYNIVPFFQKARVWIYKIIRFIGSYHSCLVGSFRKQLYKVDWWVTASSSSTKRYIVRMKCEIV